MATIQPDSALVIDCSGKVISAAIAAGNGFETAQTSEQTHGQAEALPPLVHKCLADFQRSVEKPDAFPQFIVAACGPGGFTGVRVGLSMAIGLAAGAPGSSLLGLTTDNWWRYKLAGDLGGDLDHDQGPETWLAVDTRRQDAYVTCLNQRSANWQICLATDAPWADRQVRILGNAADKFTVDAPTGLAGELDCIAIAKATLNAEFRRLCLDEDPRPLYVRPPAIHGQKPKS